MSKLSTHRCEHWLLDGAEISVEQRMEYVAFPFDTYKVKSSQVVMEMGGFSLMVLVCV